TPVEVSLPTSVDSASKITAVEENSLEFTASALVDEDELKLDMDDFQLQESVDPPVQAGIADSLEFGQDFGLSVDTVGDEGVPDLDDASPYNAEMATKLDLALAYQEIGDKEGARELLEEVIKGGSSDQVAKAKNMLDQLN
ncbi:MAG: FimV/HubP family polar landmark protein, partial [Undibacterium sp.]|nr:FimV/HubP family polar landmark protein [Undibacterium sp.]